MGGGAPEKAQQKPPQGEQPPQANKSKEKKVASPSKNQATSPSKNQIASPTKNLKDNKNTKSQPTKNIKDAKSSAKTNQTAKKQTKDSKQTTKKANNEKKTKKNEKQARCEHKKPCQFVCLNKKCYIYPFYSTSCEKNCDSKHLHSDKLTSVSLKQFQNKVQNVPKVSPVLLEQIQSYKQTLEKLQDLIQKFTTIELKQLQKLQKGEQMSQQVLKIKNCIDSKKFNKLTGAQLGQAWNNTKTQEDPGAQQSQFITEKMKNVQQLGKCFKEILSSFQDGKLKTQQQSKQQKAEDEKQGKKKTQQPHHFYKRIKLYDDMSLGKEGSWSSSKRN